MFQLGQHLGYLPSCEDEAFKKTAPTENNGASQSHGWEIPYCELIREIAESLHMKTISINSGFQRGGSLLSWDGENFNRVQRAAENTWVDDGDSSFSTEVPDNFKGAVTRFYGISSLSYCNNAELMGFSEVELDAPSPIKGWASSQGSCVRSSDDWKLVTMRDYLVALARNASIFTVEQAMEKGEKHPSGNGKVLVHLGLEAGYQAADAFAVLDKYGNILIEESGCGDGTPYPIKTEDGWNFASDREDQMREQDEMNERNNVAFKLGWSDEWANVARHLRSSYRIRQNPLKGLRKKFPGTWKYLSQGSVQEDSVVGEIRFTELSQRENETAEGPNGYSGFWGNVWGRWQVSYIPAK